MVARSREGEGGRADETAAIWLFNAEPSIFFRERSISYTNALPSLFRECSLELFTGDGRGISSLLVWSITSARSRPSANSRNALCPAVNRSLHLHVALDKKLRRERRLDLGTLAVSKEVPRSQRALHLAEKFYERTISFLFSLLVCSLSSAVQRD